MEMKLTVYIQQLIDLQETYGDLNVIRYSRDDAEYVNVDAPLVGILEDNMFDDVSNINPSLCDELNINSVSLN